MKNFLILFPDYAVRGITAICVMMLIWALIHMVYMNPMTFAVVIGGFGALIIVTTVLGWFIRDVMKL